jgi:hypothetical protein
MQVKERVTPKATFADLLNFCQVKPESGAPILLDGAGAMARWSVERQMWVPM